MQLRIQALARCPLGWPGRRVDELGLRASNRSAFVSQSRRRTASGDLRWLHLECDGTRYGQLTEAGTAVAMSPGGTPVLKLRRADQALWADEARSGFLHVSIVYHRVRYFGWIPEHAVRFPASFTAAPDRLRTAVASVDVVKAQSACACARPVPLWAEMAGVATRLGAIHANALIMIGRRAQDRWEWAASAENAIRPGSGVSLWLKASEAQEAGCQCRALSAAATGS